MSRETVVQKVLRIIDIIIRIILHPVRILLSVIFKNEYDGLEDAVTAKAAQQFVALLASEAATPEKEAIRESWSSVGFNATKDEALQSNSLLFVYLHAPYHRSAPLATSILVNPQMIDFLRQSHVQAFGVNIHTGQGAVLANMLGAVSFPLMAILQPQSSSAMNLVFLAQGGPALESLPLPRLRQSLEACRQRHMVSVTETEHRRLVREQEVELRRQQDAEYNEALEADQERERQRREAEEAEQLQQQEQERIERETTQAAEQKLQDARNLVGDEPSSGGCMVRFQLPSGAKVNRRFRADGTIGTLKAFLYIYFNDNSIGISNVGLSTNFPRKTYTDEDQTLEDAGLVPQAVVMVQDLDA